MWLWVRPGIVVYNFLKSEQGAPALSARTHSQKHPHVRVNFFFFFCGVAGPGVRSCLLLLLWPRAALLWGCGRDLGQMEGLEREGKKRIGVADSAGDFSERTVSESFSNPPLALARDWCQGREPSPSECHVPHRWGPMRYDWILTACLIFHIKNTVTPHKTLSRKSNNVEAQQWVTQLEGFN